MDRMPGKHIIPKILALIMAAVLWIYVMNEQNPPIETSLQVPLEIHSLSTTLAAMDVPDEVKVKVRGSRSLIYGLRPQDVKAYLDLKNATEGKYTAQVSATLPNGLELLEITPDTVTITLDPISSKRMPVEIRFTGSLPPGMVVGKVTADTDLITIQGPRSLINAVDRLVATVDVEGQTTDFTASVPVTPLNKESKKQEGVLLSPSNVTVNMNLVQNMTKKTVDIKPILSGELGTGIVLKSITTEPDKVEISGDPKEIGKIDAVYTEPVNLSGIDKNVNREVKLQLGENITAARSSIILHIEITRNSEPVKPKLP